MAFVQASPGMPVPAAVGPDWNKAPEAWATPAEPVQSTLVPATPLPTEEPEPAP